MPWRPARPGIKQPSASESAWPVPAAGVHSSPVRVTSHPNLWGDQRSHRIEAHADLILSLYEAQPGLYLHELRTALAERSVFVAQSSLSRFFKRHAISRKKARATRPSRSGRM